ncbi:hypothetical protein ACWIVY_09300, partial [Ursidibacter sp. B-7004-1]
MWLVNRYGIKALTLFGSFIISTYSFSHPVIAVFEAGMTESLIAAGVSETQAKSDASKITQGIYDTKFNADLNKHNIDSNRSVADYFF